MLISVQSLDSTNYKPRLVFGHYISVFLFCIVLAGGRSGHLQLVIANCPELYCIQNPTPLRPSKNSDGRRCVLVQVRLRGCDSRRYRGAEVWLVHRPPRAQGVIWEVVRWGRCCFAAESFESSGSPSSVRAPPSLGRRYLPLRLLQAAHQSAVLQPHRLVCLGWAREQRRAKPRLRGGLQWCCRSSLLFLRFGSLGRLRPLLGMCG